MATNQDFSYRELVVQHFSACHWGHRIKTGNACMLSRFSRVRLFVIPWTVAHQAPLSMGFSRQEHWSGLPFPSPMHENEVVQSCLTLREPMDCSLPGSSIHGIFQARVLEWGAIPFSVLKHKSEQFFPLQLQLHIIKAHEFLYDLCFD